MSVWSWCQTFSRAVKDKKLATQVIGLFQGYDSYPRNTISVSNDHAAPIAMCSTRMHIVTSALGRRSNRNLVSAPSWRNGGWALPSGVEIWGRKRNLERKLENARFCSWTSNASGADSKAHQHGRFAMAAKVASGTCRDQV